MSSCKPNFLCSLTRLPLTNHSTGWGRSVTMSCVIHPVLTITRGGGDRDWYCLCPSDEESESQSPKASQPLRGSWPCLKRPLLMRLLTLTLILVSLTGHSWVVKLQYHWNTLQFRRWGCCGDSNSSVTSNLFQIIKYWYVQITCFSIKCLWTVTSIQKSTHRKYSPVVSPRTNTHVN